MNDSAMTSKKPKYTYQHLKNVKKQVLLTMKLLNAPKADIRFIDKLDPCDCAVRNGWIYPLPYFTKYFEPFLQGITKKDMQRITSEEFKRKWKKKTE